MTAMKTLAAIVIAMTSLTGCRDDRRLLFWDSLSDFFISFTEPGADGIITPDDPVFNGLISRSEDRLFLPDDSTDVGISHAANVERYSNTGEVPRTAKPDEIHNTNIPDDAQFLDGSGENGRIRIPGTRYFGCPTFAEMFDVDAPEIRFATRLFDPVCNGIIAGSSTSNLDEEDLGSDRRFYAVIRLSGDGVSTSSHVADWGLQSFEPFSHPPSF